MKAVREALDKVSLPTLLQDVPGGVSNARVKAKIGVPKHVKPFHYTLCNCAISSRLIAILLKL